MKNQSYQSGIKLAIGTGKEGTGILDAVSKRAKEKGISRNKYIIELIKKDLGWKSNGKH